MPHVFILQLVSADILPSLARPIDRVWRGMLTAVYRIKGSLFNLNLLAPYRVPPRGYRDFPNTLTWKPTQKSTKLHRNIAWFPLASTGGKRSDCYSSHRGKIRSQVKSRLLSGPLPRQLGTFSRWRIRRSAKQQKNASRSLASLGR